MSRQWIRSVAMCSFALSWAAACFAAGGKVSYPNGTPVAGAEVNVHLQEVDKYRFTTDAGGRFTLPTMEFQDAFVQIKAPDGKEYATVNLPVQVFSSGDISIVLQPKQ